MPKPVTAKETKSWLSDGREIAFLDVRELGRYGEAHPFFAVPVHYSGFELRLPKLVPNPGVRMVLVDDGDGVGERAAAAAEAMGYCDVHVLTGGIQAWADAGFTLYAGVNVPSKTFGELLELARHTPRLSAQEVRDLQQSGSDHVIVDGRPFTEYNNFSIPGGICCPNGELALRIDELVADPQTTIIVNCAGRTRSILGAQTLIDAGVENPVFALENGTQGWFLAGLEVARGATDKYPAVVSEEGLEARRQTVRALAATAGVKFASSTAVRDILGDATRTSYLFDVRTAEEVEADGFPGALHAPGGQLVQSTDQWVGVRGARLVLLDTDGIRAPMVANWLSQLGHETIVVEGVAGGEALAPSSKSISAPSLKAPPSIKATDVDPEVMQLVDLRPSMAFRDGHIDGARWSIRPRLSDLGLDPARPIVLIGAGQVVTLASSDLAGAGCSALSHLAGGPEDWRRAGLTIAASKDRPADADCIDFLFFTAGRHDGDEAASRQYLQWEIGLVDQLDEQERNAFRIVRP